MSKTAPRAFARLLFAAMPLILMTACADEFGVSPMPDGYKYSQQYSVPGTPATVHVYPGEFKQAAPAPQPVMDTTMAAPVTPVAESAPTPVTPAAAAAPAAAPMADAMAGAVAPQWQHAADDLLARTEKNFGKLKDPVAVRAASMDKPGETSFAAALTHALEMHRYAVQNDSAKPPPFGFDYAVGAPEASGHTAITLVTDAQGAPVHKETGTYDMAGSGALVPSIVPPMTDNSVKPAQPVARNDAPPATPMHTSSAGSISRAEDTQPAAGTPDADMGASKVEIMSHKDMVSSAPPPPMAGDSAPDYSSKTGGPGDQTTYVYDSHMSAKNPGKTAYDQYRGAGKVVPADEGDDAAPPPPAGGDVH
jgi:hypothetical protein